MAYPGGTAQDPHNRARIVADMVQRSFAGPIANVFAIAVFLFGTDLLEQHPFVTSLFLGILTFRLLGRAVFTYVCRKRVPAGEPPLWLIGFSAYALSVPTGCYAAFVLHSYGYEDWNTVLMYVFAMVCAISGTTALAPDLRLGLGYQASLLLPVVAASLAADGRHCWVGAISAILFAAYAVMQAIRQNTEYRNAQAASDALRCRAEELEVAQAAAAAASEAKSRFLANMSHEIRTPMNGVLGMLELVLRSDLSSGQQQDLGYARDSAQSLLVLLNQILDHAKAEAGRLELEQMDFSVREVVRSAAVPFRFQAAEKKIALNCTVEPSVPQCLRGDPTRLRQIIINLVANALKFTPSGSIEVSVRVESVTGPQVLLSFHVADSGPGIPPDKLETIFDAFSQADSSITRRFGGTGLGLTICRDLVELMGGRIQVESQPGHGSVFSFTAMFTMSSSEKRETEPARAEPPVCNPLRVLMAEDNVVNQKILMRILQAGGHSVVLAEDGLQAVSRFSEGWFDVVLMDVQMPRMDGLQATRQIRATAGRDVPIIGVTAGATPAEVTACFEAGMDSCITKPINISKLQELLARVRAGNLPEGQPGCCG